MLKQNTILSIVAKKLESFLRNHLELFSCPFGVIQKIENLTCTIQEDLPKSNNDPFCYVGKARFWVLCNEDNGEIRTIDYEWRGTALVDISIELKTDCINTINIK